MIFMDVTCNVIEDLLPLYADGICSEDTKTIIEHHIAVCPECREKLEAMTAKLEKNEKKAEIDNPFKKVKNHYVRLVTVTLLVCALVIVPLGGVWCLSVNTQYSNGYTWSSLKMENKLRKIANMLKRGKYREMLDEFELYYDREQYTPEEVSMYKDMFAMDFEFYFTNNEIRAVFIYVDKGDCDSGWLTVLTKNSDVIQMWFDLNDDERLFFNTFDYETYFNTGMPQMQLLNKNSVKTYFDFLRSKDTLHSAVQYIQTANNNREFNYDIETHMKTLENKFAEMIDKYSYVGCEGGEITYCRDSIPLNTYYYVNRYYSQKAVITMAKKDGEEFTISCDVAVQSDTYPYQAILAVRDITYSDNTPEDFKTMFEDIFA